MSSVISPTAVLQPVLYALATSAGIYGLFIVLLTVPYIQTQVIYLNIVTMTWGQDVNIPEQWGFLHNQVTPFQLKTPDEEILHAWHILPLELYRQNQQILLNEASGLVPDITERLGFRLLRDNPNSLLVLYLHGAAGTLGSGYRPPSYRAIYDGAPDRIHVVAIDYRGFGTSTGRPSEDGLVTDATALVDWAMKEAGIPADRIVIWAQSIGTAVASSLVQQLAMRPVPVLFAGLILVAPFADVKTLTATYQIAGTLPILGPLARFPRLLEYLNTFIRDKWPSKDRLASFVRHCENLPGGSRKYHITIIHAQDDYDIPWSHSDQIFWHAVNASVPTGISVEDLEKEKDISKMDLGAGGWVVDRQATKGVIREEIAKHGLHDRIMGYPIISLAVVRAFGIE